MHVYSELWWRDYVAIVVGITWREQLDTNLWLVRTVTILHSIYSLRFVTTLKYSAIGFLRIPQLIASYHKKDSQMISYHTSRAAVFAKLQHSLTAAFFVALGVPTHDQKPFELDTEKRMLLIYVSSTDSRKTPEVISVRSRRSITLFRLKRSIHTDT